jgi:hypothetical protein
MINNTKVAIVESDVLDYHRDPPFNPSQYYPEYPFKYISSKHNTVYDLVRKSFVLLGLDIENYGTDA